MSINKTMLAIGLPLIAATSLLSAAKRNNTNCEPTPPVPCYEDTCCRTYCLGPENYGVNAAVNPRTCNGDWVISIAGLYWNAHENGLEYGIENQVTANNWISGTTSGQYINAELETPHFNWDFGFKVGLGYNTTCDGWDFGVLWTRYNGTADSHIEAETDDNRILLSLWSVLTGTNAPPTFFTSGFAQATDMETKWSLDLNLIDLELGRKYWNSRRLAFRPFIGLRLASLKQNYAIQNKGGIFSVIGSVFPGFISSQTNDEIDMNNYFKGVGIRGGINSTWNLGCGWAIYGNLAFSAVYGRFDIEHDETLYGAVAPFSKLKVHQMDESFRGCRQMTDLELGVQWSSLFCNCSYALTASLGWEIHLFPDQNQLSRTLPTTGLTIPNSATVNQTHGDLDTQGWTLKLTLDF